MKSGPDRDIFIFIYIFLKRENGVRSSYHTKQESSALIRIKI